MYQFALVKNHLYVREKIIELKREGHKNSEIAKRLGCSESTVNNFMTKYNKMCA